MSWEVSASTLKTAVHGLLQLETLQTLHGVNVITSNYEDASRSCGGLPATEHDKGRWWETILLSNR